MSTFWRRWRRSALLRLLHALDQRRRRLLAWHTMVAAGVQSASAVRGELTWRVPVGDPYIGFSVFVDDGFGQEGIDALLSWLAANRRALDQRDVLVDVGANIGTTCIPVVHRHGCRAVAIEPVPLNVQFLRENIATNKLTSRISIVEAAVTAAPARVHMEVGVNSGGAAVLPGATVGSEGVTTVEVSGLPLSDLLTQAGVAEADVTLVWADVQGCETVVIETATALWSAGVPLWAEFEPASLARQGGVTAFFEAAERHFAGFIELSQLLRAGPTAAAREIGALRQVLATVPLQTDVLLLPRSFQYKSA